LAEEDRLTELITGLEGHFNTKPEHSLQKQPHTSGTGL